MICGVEEGFCYWRDFVQDISATSDTTEGSMGNWRHTGGSLALVLLCFLSFDGVSEATDTITAVQSLRDGETIVSSGGIFELGFFSPGNSSNRYVGMWYKKISNRTVVWVANREVAVANRSGVLNVIEPGILVLLSDANNTIWSSNTSRSVQNPVAQLLDNGNLVLKDAYDDNPDNFLWQSFDYPSDTLLPGMKLGRNFITGLERYISSWKNTEDPSPGDYSYHCDPTGYPQDVLRKGSDVIYRAGPWNGLRWSGAPNMQNGSVTTFGLVYNQKEVSYSFDMVNKSAVSLFVVTSNGEAERTLWVDRTRDWIVYHAAATDDCDTYKLCGAYGTCNIGNSPVCGCLDKFEPRRPDDWGSADWSGGCVRRTSLACRGDGFQRYSGIKLPDTKNAWFNRSMTLEECKTICLSNCSCMAYTNLDISKGGSGCLLWLGELIDIRELSSGGQDIYVRLASSEIGTEDGSNGKKGGKLSVTLPVVAGIILAGLCVIFYIWKRGMKDRKLKTKGIQEQNYKNDYNVQIQNEDFELPLFDLSAITKATSNFSAENKLGEGGFGPVHKGVLDNGQEIAVKRLSETSTQGLYEFKNEVNCIAKLQHRNLVKLLGCCIQGGEKMLIYEYMPNKSLDSFIFGQRSTLLDWTKRFQIINGIARGLMYLHQDSRLRIIHRDLKASNILLDCDMNPKISDFGIAKSFKGNETGSNTRRVVGTYGYMAPEYAVDGLFSVKSDVFSFGVLMLEIVSGMKNRGFFHPDHDLNLLGHAYKLHKEGRSLEFVDSHLDTECHEYELLRSIHVGLLCVQQYPQDRPNMSSVVFMLSNEGVLPEAKEPGFFTSRKIPDVEYSSSTRTPGSVNEITITLLNAR